MFHSNDNNPWTGRAAVFGESALTYTQHFHFWLPSTFSSDHQIKSGSEHRSYIDWTIRKVKQTEGVPLIKAGPGRRSGQPWPRWPTDVGRAPAKVERINIQIMYMYIKNRTQNWAKSKYHDKKRVMQKINQKRGPRSVIILTDSIMITIMKIRSRNWPASTRGS